MRSRRRRRSKRGAAGATEQEEVESVLTTFAGVPHTKEEFVQAANVNKHPFDEQCRPSDGILEAIADILRTGPSDMAKRRKQQLKK